MPKQANNDTSAIQPLPPLLRKSLESGLITKGAISENRSPETSCTESLNFDFDTIGAATLRKGVTLIGNNLGGPILGMHYFSDTLHGGTNTQLIVGEGTGTYYLSG